MLPNKITKNFKEISKSFVENFDNSASAIFTVLDMLKLSDKNLCFSTNYNAKYSQTVKFILILLMPFFRIRNVLNYCKSIFYSKINCGKDTLYRFKRDNSICIRLTKKSKWRTIITTDVDLDFERAMEIYAMRWSIEVFFKECKQHLLLNSCQSVDFDAQIAEITFSFVRFNILSTILRKQKYDTMGGLFEEINKDTLELTINERIILFIIKRLQIFSNFCNLLMFSNTNNKIINNLKL
ncbi:MAG: transposase [Bacteroidales bacterium]|nr:transposase [Bacteroidales bacterium]